MICTSPKLDNKSVFSKITLNKIWGKNNVPHYEAQLLFNQLGFNFDVHQYRDIISMADVYHIYDRKHKVLFNSFLHQAHLMSID